MLFVVALVMFCVNTIMQLLPYEWAPRLVEGQLVFYVLMLLLGMNIMNMTRDSFNMGLRGLSNETKLELFIAVKAFFVVFLAMKAYPTKHLLDFDVLDLHVEMNARINLALRPFGNPPLYIPAEFSYGLYGLIAAILSFCLTRIHLRFAFFFHSTTETEFEAISEDDSIE